MMKTREREGFLYEQIAFEIAALIEKGTYRPGTRIPSVREMSRQRNASVSTILEAYRLLENRGQIEVRPQSGYYVSPGSREGLPTPEERPEHVLDPMKVTVEELTMKVFKDTLDPGLVQFGAAIPDPALLPTARLGRILSRYARRDDVRQNICGISKGCEELRVQVAKHIAGAGVSVSPEELLITAGCMEALSLSLRSVCSPGDTVAIESPTYFGVLQALESQRLRALEIPTHPVSGISLDALRFAIENQRVNACVVMTNYSNPLGCTMSDENKRLLVRLLASKGIPLVEDDIHGEIGFSARRPTPAKAFDEKGLVLLCSSFSKDLSPIFRVGWVAPGIYMPEIERLKLATNGSTPILTQLTIAEFLESGGYAHHLRKIRQAYAEKTTRMAQAVQRYFPEGTRVSSPAGGFVLWIQLPETVDSLVLYRNALKAGITLVPGYLFSPGDRYRNCIRLNAAYYSERTDAAVKRLGELVSILREPSDTPCAP